MNRDEAYALAAKACDVQEWHHDADSFKAGFNAGWDTHIESLKQTQLPLGPNHDHAAPRISTLAEEIWSHWPVKKARGAAIPAIGKAIKKVGAEALLQAVKDYAKALETWPAQDRQYIPMCSTWMNQERWMDDRKEWVRGAAAMPSQFSRS